jgi:uncharacterized protein YcbK (DUF882 family)
MVKSCIEQEKQGSLSDINVSSQLMSRRKLLTGITASAAAILLGPLCQMAEAAQPSTKGKLKLSGETIRSLSFYSPNTKEHLAVTYFDNGRYVRSALKEVNRHFRDHYCGRVHVIDPHLLDYLYSIKIELGVTGPFHVLSAYRTPATNNMLRRHSHKVAKHSYHIYGKAVDIRVPGISTSKLRRAAYNLKLGGVGYYKRERFVHVDTGQFRAWWG